MIRLIRHLSLATKLRLMIVYAAGAALFVASALYVTSEVLSLRQGLAQQLVTLAQSVAQNVGSLPATDRTLVRAMLQSMQVDPNVRTVALFDAGGHPIAGMSFGDQQVSPTEQLELRLTGAPAKDDRTIRFRGFTFVQIQVPVEVNGAKRGTIQVNADLAQLYPQLKRYLELMGLALSAAWLVAIFLATRMQRAICAPINELLDVAQQVRASRKFTIRAQKHSDDELGRLVDGFNGMLAELERRDLSLRVKEAAFRLGFVFLMAVVAFVLYNDISKLAG